LLWLISLAKRMRSKSTISTRISTQLSAYQLIHSRNSRRVTIGSTTSSADTRQF
jgi:hypothetical protein